MWEPFACQTSTQCIPSHCKSCRDAWWNKDGTFRRKHRHALARSMFLKGILKNANCKDLLFCSLMFVFAETMDVRLRLKIQTCGCCQLEHKLLGPWQPRRDVFFLRNGSHQRHGYSTCILSFWYFLICILLDYTPFLEATVVGFRGKVDGIWQQLAFQVSLPLAFWCLISPQMLFRTVSIETPLWFHL